MSDRTERSERLQRRFERGGSDDDGETSAGSNSSVDDPTPAAGDDPASASDDSTSTTEQSAETTSVDGDSPTADDRSVKDRPSTLMYLPEPIHRDLDLTFDEVNLTYRREYGEKLEKNRDYYPLVAIYGIDRLRQWDADEIRDALDGLPGETVD